jgi:hypothetical protein
MDTITIFLLYIVAVGIGAVLRLLYWIVDEKAKK